MSREVERIRMHMSHCNKPQRKSLEGLRTNDEHVHPLYLDTFDCICIHGGPGTVFGGLIVRRARSAGVCAVNENHWQGQNV